MRTDGENETPALIAGIYDGKDLDSVKWSKPGNRLTAMINNLNTTMQGTALRSAVNSIKEIAAKHALTQIAVKETETGTTQNILAWIAANTDESKDMRNLVGGWALCRLSRWEDHLDYAGGSFKWSCAGENGTVTANFSTGMAVAAHTLLDLNPGINSPAITTHAFVMDSAKLASRYANSTTSNGDTLVALALRILMDENSPNHHYLIDLSNEPDMDAEKWQISNALIWLEGACQTMLEKFPTEHFVEPNRQGSTALDLLNQISGAIIPEGQAILSRIINNAQILHGVRTSIKDGIHDAHTTTENPEDRAAIPETDGKANRRAVNRRIMTPNRNSTGP